MKQWRVWIGGWLVTLGVASLGCEAPSNQPVAESERGPAVEPAPPAAGEETRRPAEVGVGRSSQRMQQHDEGVGRMVAQPAVTLFAAREKVVFEIQIPHAMNLYKALQGDFPKSHDEFMAQIIQANQITLPDLPPGQRYEYDAESAQLMVVMPQN